MSDELNAEIQNQLNNAMDGYNQAVNFATNPLYDKWNTHVKTVNEKDGVEPSKNNPYGFSPKTVELRNEYLARIQILETRQSEIGQKFEKKLQEFAGGLQNTKTASDVRALFSPLQQKMTEFFTHVQDNLVTSQNPDEFIRISNEKVDAIFKDVIVDRKALPKTASSSGIAAKNKNPTGATPTTGFFAPLTGAFDTIFPPGIPAEQQFRHILNNIKAGLGNLTASTENEIKLLESAQEALTRIENSHANMTRVRDSQLALNNSGSHEHMIKQGSIESQYENTIAANLKQLASLPDLSARHQLLDGGWFTDWTGLAESIEQNNKRFFQTFDPNAGLSATFTRTGSMTVKENAIAGVDGLARTLGLDERGQDALVHTFAGFAGGVEGTLGWVKDGWDQAWDTDNDSNSASVWRLGLGAGGVGLSLLLASSLNNRIFKNNPMLRTMGDVGLVVCAGIAFVAIMNYLSQGKGGHAPKILQNGALKQNHGGATPGRIRNPATSTTPAGGNGPAGSTGGLTDAEIEARIDEAFLIDEVRETFKSGIRDEFGNIFTDAQLEEIIDEAILDTSSPFRGLLIDMVREGDILLSANMTPAAVQSMQTGSETYIPKELVENASKIDMVNKARFGNEANTLFLSA